MCVPFGKILNGMAAPNTVTKTLHLEKSFSPDLTSFRIREYPNYASIEDQVRTIRSFRRPVILVDDILENLRGNWHYSSAWFGSACWRSCRGKTAEGVKSREVQEDQGTKIMMSLKEKQNE